MSFLAQKYVWNCRFLNGSDKETKTDISMQDEEKGEATATGLSKHSAALCLEWDAYQGDKTDRLFDERSWWWT